MSKMKWRLTERQKWVLRMLSLCPGGTSMAYMLYSNTGKYPYQIKGEVPKWKQTFTILRKRRLIYRRFDYTHWNWVLTSAGLHLVRQWLVRSRKLSLRVSTG